MTTATEREAEALLLRNPNYRAARDWALANMSDADLAEYNKLIAEPATRSAGVDFLYGAWIEAKRAAEAPAAPQMPEARDPALYYSAADLAADTRKPEYQHDARFREEVAFKLHKSKQAGVFESLNRSHRQAESISRLPDHDAASHAAAKKEQEAQRAADHAAELERRAQEVRAEAAQAEQKAQWRQWN